MLSGRLYDFGVLMKILRIIAVFCILLAVLPGIAAAAPAEGMAEAFAIGDFERAVPDEAEEILDGLSPETGLETETIMNRLGNYLRDHVDDVLGGALKNAAAVLSAALFCSAAAALCEKSDYAVLVGVLAISAAAVSDISSLMSVGRETLTELSAFSKVLLPTLASTAAASGAYTSAAAKYAASAMFIDLLITAAENVVIPLIYAYMAASVGAAALGGTALSGAASFLKWLAAGALTLITLSFTAYLSVTGLITGTADAAATRAAKTAVSAALPVVGGIISDAAGTVLIGASVLRNTVGVFGLAVVLAVCLLPFLRLGAGYLAYKAAAALSSAVADGRIAKLIGAVGTAYGLTLGTVGAAAVMLFISVISSVKAVT